MQRLHDSLIDTLQQEVDFTHKTVLEIGCGNGARAVQLAALCLRVAALDPRPRPKHTAAARPKNLVFLAGRAEALPFASGSFDYAVSTMSFHHVPSYDMHRATDEVARVLKPDGRAIFIEPTSTSSAFDAEAKFDAGEGDESNELAEAYEALCTTRSLKPCAEYFDTALLVFDSVNDFIKTMQPKQHLDEIESFLAERDYVLTAERRINIFTPA